MKVAIASDSPSFSTGYGVAASQLGKYLLKEGYEVAFISFQHGSAPLYHRVDSNSYLPVYSGSTQQNIDRSIREIKPELIIHIRDAFAHIPKYYPAPYTLVGRGAKVILWVPVQGAPLPQEFIDACNNHADHVVALTEWGKEQLLFQGVLGNKLDAIPIGYDPSIWYPKQVSKEDYGFAADRKLVGSIGINDQYRKGWPILIKAAAIALRKVDLDLYLHTAELGHYDLITHARSAGLSGHLLFPAGYDKGWGIDEWKLSSIVNCFDIYASASIAEGQSVPLLEAAAAGKQLLVTDMPVYREVFGNYAVYAATYQLYPSTWSFDYVADPADMAEQMVQMLEKPFDPSAQLEHVKKYSWPQLIGKWKEVIEKVV